MTDTLTREAATKRFDQLSLPTTADEHWRFTDLRGFDPESFAGAGGPVEIETMLDLVLPRHPRSSADQ